MLLVDDIEPIRKPATLSIALEYVGDTFNFYIKKMSHCPPLVSTRIEQSRAVLHVSKGLSRSTWMGRQRTIPWLEIQASSPQTYRTMCVPRCETTVFNEFFSCTLEKEFFNNTLLKIQFCDVGHHDKEAIIAECDYWVDSNPIERFREFEIPVTVSTPDLGELELSLMYLPTAQRLIVSNCRLTNLKIFDECTEVYVRATLFLNDEFDEIHKTEHRPPKVDSDGRIVFSKKLIFDLMRMDVKCSTLVVRVVQMCSQSRKETIGAFGLSFLSSSCSVDCRQWRRMLSTPRQNVTAIHKLRPSL